MSNMKSVLLLTNTFTEPFVPAGTIAAFATTVPRNEFNVETTGWATPVGQIGESILSFTRSLAVSNNQIYALTISGLTILPPNFDVALAKPVITSVVNSADGTTALAVGICPAPCP